MGRFDGQVVVVTGAGGGLGRAHARLLAADGARVLVNDYGGDTHGNAGTSAPAEAVVDEIRAAGGIAEADSRDVSAHGEDVVAHAMECFGRLDAVVNNAGIANGGTVETMPAAEFQRVLDVHLGGTVAVCRAAWPIFRAQGGGRIVNTSSGSVFGLSGTFAYITAKAAIFGLTRALALDGRDIGVRVNAIMPVAYSRLTAQSPDFAAILARSFPPERVAPLVAALASAAVPCSGETFIVGGGRTARVALATVPGLVGADTVDDVLDRFAEAMDSSELVVPADAMAELVYECANLGVDLSALSGPGQ